MQIRSDTTASLSSGNTVRSYRIHLLVKEDAWEVSILEFLAARLKELRSRHDLTQEQTASLLGTDMRWYQRIEAQEKDVRASTIDRLAAIFGISGSELLAAKIPETRVTAQPQKAPHRPKRKTSEKKSQKR
jgi:DNA-binding XRE family transcriptional regulator